MGGARDTHGGDEKCRQVFWKKNEGNRLFGKPKPTWEGNIEMDLNK
jgi:hypothetical protein